MTRTMLCAALGLSMAMGAMTAAQAEEGQMRVNLAGLDLNSVDGAKAALARIRWSASVFCEVPAGRESLEREGIIYRCLGDMTKKGVDMLHAPLVTALLQATPATPEPQAIPGSGPWTLEVSSPKDGPFVLLETLLVGNDRHVLVVTAAGALGGELP